MDVFAIEWRDEALIELGDDGVGGAIALVLDGLHLLNAHAKVVRILEDAAEELRALREVARKLVEEFEKTSFVRYETQAFSLECNSRSRLRCPQKPQGCCSRS